MQEKTITLRHMPESLHLRLKHHAKESKMSLNAYLLRELGTIVIWPTPEELRERLKRLPPIGVDD